MTPYELVAAPFLEFGFMRRALAACLALSLGCGPVGVLLVLRRMSLMGDALSHAVLPGAAVGFLAAGLSLWAMSIGGIVAGLAVALLAGLVSRATPLREDASFAAFYLISLAAGVLIVSTRGSNLDLMHVLFGTILAVDDGGLLLVAGVATLTLLALALLYRPLVVESFDPGFLQAVGGRGPGAACHLLFLVLVVLNLVGGFQALGTLMAVGLMMLPAAAARFWAERVATLALAAMAVAFASGVGGLLLSFHLDLPSGPAIVLAAGGAYLLSLAVGPVGSLRVRWFPRRHLAA
ncbi:metal ABC transporter permease [Azospirillum picis]|uniref:Zinc/manganese transport system permease protein n=1 Tax=Azospirillum picis TaxID=488438 RepID=A0ABU0MJ53_9PROT|nr:metal ABC transporter permease [Azospirillum picis]MBP2299699.1 zinc/manganese transport system permease protein [Azospirillum picis]MDQ0533495.1 zinc/manganese transport system permease protein [Azospirillum picis]